MNWLVLAAALSVGCFDFFFVPPFYTLDVADRTAVDIAWLEAAFPRA